MKKAKISEKHIKFLQNLKYGIFPIKKRKSRHYSLENIRNELYEVYKYKNELEENKQIDAISKKLNSIIRTNEKFWGKNEFLPKISHSENQEFTQKLKENLTGNSTRSVESLKAKSFIYTKGAKKIRLYENVL